MRNLIKNESIKIRRQAAYKVLTVIILVIALLIPIGHFGITLILKWDDESYSLEDQANNFTEIAEVYENQGDESSFVMAAVYRGYAESRLFFAEHDLADSWKLNQFSSKLMNLAGKLAVYRLLAEGTVTYEDVLGSGCSYMIEEDLLGYDDSGEKEAGLSVTVTEAESDIIYGYGGSYEVDFDDVDWKAEYDRRKTEYADFEQYILDCTPKVLIRSELLSAEERLASAEENARVMAEQVAEAKAAMKEDDERSVAEYENCLYEYDLMQAEVSAMREAMWGMQFLYDNDCDPDSWQYTTVKMALTSGANLYYPSLVVMPKSVWEELYGNSTQTYEEYCEACENNEDRVTYGDMLLIARYALEHDTAPSQMLDTSSKSTFRMYFYILTGLISILMIVMMGMVVANEFSSGTIRLLVIRPRKRHKILTAKILSVLLYISVLTAIGTAVMLLLTMIFFGVGDLFTADLFAVNGTVLSVPAVLSFAAYAALTFLGILLCAAVALFFSAVTKKAALAIVIPMIVNSYSALFQIFSLSLANSLPFLKYTILPYLTPTVLFTSPLDTLGSSSLSGMLYGGFYGTIASLNGIYGICLMLCHIVVVVLLTYVIFNRQQIKR